MRHDSPSTSRDQAVALHRSGRIEQAMAAYRLLLARQPDSADLLGLLAVACEQIGDAAEAERLLRLSLRNRASIPLSCRNLNNLLGLLIEAGRSQDAQAAVEEHLPPAWPPDQVPDAVEQGTLVSLVSALKQLGLADNALAFGVPLLPVMGHDVDFALLVAEFLHGAGRKDEAAAVLDRDFGPGEDLPNLHAVRAVLAHERDDSAACVRSSRLFAASMPTLLAEAAPSQRCVLAVFNKAPDRIMDFRQAHGHHYSGNFPSQVAQAFADRFRFVSVLANAPTAVAALREMPRPALALNNVVNAEQLMVDDTLAQVSALEDSLGVPVINHPRLAVQATRQKNSERFANRPGIIFPRISRYLSSKAQRADLIQDIESRFGYPLILRTVFQQMGAGTWLVANREELGDALERLEGLQFYAIAYIPTRHADGRFRALRAAFVDGRVHVIRADFSEGWNVRARRTPHQQLLYRDNPHLLERANAIVRDPMAKLGKAVLDRLDTVAKLMPLDIFGMDFDVTDDGDLLIFEINATMNLLSTSPEGLEYPAEVETALRGSLEQCFLRRLPA